MFRSSLSLHCGKFSFQMVKYILWPIVSSIKWSIPGPAAENESSDSYYLLKVYVLVYFALLAFKLASRSIFLIVSGQTVFLNSFSATTWSFGAFKMYESLFFVQDIAYLHS